MILNQSPTPPKRLNLPKEGSYFAFVLVASILVWLLIAFSIVGIFYAAIFAFGAWLGNGLLTARLRAEAVRVGPNQLPELDASFRLVCERLGIKEAPALYVLESGGALNAFATRFSGRNFVVVHSDLLEAFGPDSGEMRFILGHEIGHIQSNHLPKRLLLAPGLFFPLIGPAYLRACESSCDLYGAWAAEDLDASVRAMLALSGGRGQARALDAAVFAQQHLSERGFFVSLHELTSAYPTLSQRVSQLMQLAPDPNRLGFAPRPASLSFLAYLVALGMPGGRMSGGASGLLMVIVIVGMLAAMAIPAFGQVRATSQAKVCENNRRTIQAAVEHYELENGRRLGSMTYIVGTGKLLPALPECPSGGTYDLHRDVDGSRVVTTARCSFDHAAAVRRPGEPR